MKKVYVKSRPAVEEYSATAHEETSVLVSIASRDQEPAKVCCNEINNIKDILYLYFNDTDSLEKDSGHIEDSDGEQIKNFIEKYINTDIDAIIVNCGAGQSRSAGVAAAILMHYTGNEDQIYKDKQYTPNRLCYSTVLKAFEGEKDYASIFG